jgi:hypothetical protein
VCHVVRGVLEVFLLERTTPLELTVLGYLDAQLTLEALIQAVRLLDDFELLLPLPCPRYTGCEHGVMHVLVEEHPEPTIKPRDVEEGVVEVLEFVLDLL